ncbi:hypothetical protein Ahy_A04g018920 [Arachis hypogaea]|uniref:Protein FAR1-RELATED SEQUENCE n=1 Tax=Arachis hypogaea TaxID=3818 RepID=A0A445DEX4_ARAHY|nr:hypothetical protein Ahy_A04g018920 [Arachis hypogaea]
MLDNLLEVMCLKKAFIVVTNGDESMIVAVRVVFPEATHRLCFVTCSQSGFMQKWRLQTLSMIAEMEIADFKDTCWAITSRCEGINSQVKNSLSSRHTILELVQNLELLVYEYRNNELVAQFNSMYRVPVMTTCLNPIEKCAASIYTS